MVIDAILLSKPNDAQLIGERALLECSYDLLKALQSFSECFALGGGSAPDYSMYGRLLLQHGEDQQAAVNALNLATSTCEPHERFHILVECATGKRAIGDLQGSLQHLAEADTLGQLDFHNLEVLAELHNTANDSAAAASAYDKAAVVEPSNASIRQKRALCKLDLGDVAGGIADLDAAILLGLNDANTYTVRGFVRLQHNQLELALADFDQAHAKEPLYETLVWRAEAKHRMVITGAL